jgi:adenine-specific DNA-methyltransferase
MEYEGTMSEVKEIAESPNPADLKRQALAELLPEAFSEGRLDTAALKRVLGDDSAIDGGERYALTWAGKSNAYKVLQTPTTATLRPQRDLSVNFDEAQHVFIEGENLEVLKVLQKTYFGKVKLIYIDPPYNTGSDSFIYPDRFQESKQEYLKRINALDDDGTLMKEGFFRKNTKDSGHYHSNWLSMMLPRLYIARNLLREDGVIFISCDDNEVHNLRCLMNEVFGEDNFLCVFAWEKRYSPPPDTKDIGYLHESIVMYRRSSNFGRNLLPLTDEQKARYKNPDNDSRGLWKAMDYTCRYTADERPNLYYPIKHPKSGKEVWPKKTRVWAMSKEVHARNELENRLWWGINGENEVPALKNFLSDIQAGMMPTSLLKHEMVGHTDEATKELRDLIPEIKFTPKPVRLMKHLMQISCQGDEIILDFFAGSGTLGQAVLELNQENNDSFRFICVQLPEGLERESEAFRAGYKTISDVCRVRINRVIEKIKNEADLYNQPPTNIGFKSFQLVPSNFKQWRGDEIETTEELAEQIKLFTKTEKDGAQPENVLYELLLKFGQPLTSAIEVLDVSGVRVFAVKNRVMMFILESFELEMIEPLLALKPKEIIALDSVFHDSDQLKSNLELSCRDAGVQFVCL